VTSWKRITAEHRAWMLPIVIAIFVNIAIFVAVVFPLGRQVADLDQQARQVHATLAKARLDYQGARATAQGKVQADASLAKFYKDVLPQNASSARRITYLRLAQLASEANVRLERGDNAIEKQKGSSLEKLSTSYTLSGDYRDVRRFIYALETAPEFLVLESLTLRGGDQSGRGLAMTIGVATYYRAANGD
jgi:Tfp pilus assembly protein PilO